MWGTNAEKKVGVLKEICNVIRFLCVYFLITALGGVPEIL